MPKLDEHIADLAKNTSGGAHDAVTFSGEGLNILGRLIKGAGNLGNFFKGANSNGAADMDLDDLLAHIDENDLEAPRKKKGESDEDYAERLRPIVKKSMKKNANGGDLETQDQDPDDPGQKNAGKTITNHGDTISHDALSAAIAKNGRSFDERRFEKSMGEMQAEHGEVLDATPALAALAQQMGHLAKSMDAGANATQQSIIVLAKGMEQMLNAQASLAADLELIKKQPVTSPASGVFMKNFGGGGNAGGGGEGRRLTKSEVQDSLTTLLNKGEVDPQTLSQLDFCRNEHELQRFVESLPQSIQCQL